MNDLPINEKLKRLIKKDLEKEIGAPLEVNLNLIQSSTGGHPKHNLKAESPLKNKGKSQQLLQKIKDRTKETKKNFLDFGKSKSPLKKKQLAGKESLPIKRDDFEISRINDKFSKTLNYENAKDFNEEVDFLKNFRKKVEKPVVSSVSDFSELKRKYANCRASQTLNDLLRMKASDALFHKKKVNKSLHLRDFLEKSRQDSEVNSFKKGNSGKSFSKSNRSIPADFSKKSLKASLAESTKKGETKTKQISTKGSLRGSKVPQISASLKSSNGFQEEGKVAKSSNFSKKKIDSEVFDRLTRPKSPLVVLKASKSSSKTTAEKESSNQNSFSQEDVVLSSFKMSQHEKQEIMFDSSLIKLENLPSESQSSFRKSVKEPLVALEVFESEEQVEEKVEVELEKKVFKKKQQTEVLVEEGEEDV